MLHEVTMLEKAFKCCHICSKTDQIAIGTVNINTMTNIDLPTFPPPPSPHTPSPLHSPSLFWRERFSHSVRWRTKSKKKSPSGTLITLSVILTNRENPSELRRPRRSAILAQKSFERVLESTSKAWMEKEEGRGGGGEERGERREWNERR